MRIALDLLKRFVRTLALVLLVVAGSTVLVRFAPGYFSDAREMDVRYAGAARAELIAEASRGDSAWQIMAAELRGWRRGDLGTSRQYGIPVLALIQPRLAVTTVLLVKAILFAWTLSLCVALFSSASRRAILFWQAPAVLLLAVPTAALATLCLIADSGGPVLVMTLVLAARDFKFLDRALRKEWGQAHLLQARAAGIPTASLVRAHLLPGIASQLRALATLSIVSALSALVPVEVIFNVPGLGQLAWNAALNRDLPVLLGVTVILAIAVALAGMASGQTDQWRAV